MIVSVVVNIVVVVISVVVIHACDCGCCDVSVHDCWCVCVHICIYSSDGVPYLGRLCMFLYVFVVAIDGYGHDCKSCCILQCVWSRLWLLWLCDPWCSRLCK